MGIEERIAEIVAAARAFYYVRRLEKVDETRYSVKYRLHITPGLFVQLYFNEENGTAALALVCEGQRIYGRDNTQTGWHRHPYGTSHTHDTTPEGARPVTVAEFLAEVQEILEEENLL